MNRANIGAQGNVSNALAAPRGVREKLPHVGVAPRTLMQGDTIKHKTEKYHGGRMFKLDVLKGISQEKEKRKLTSDPKSDHE